MRVSLQGKLSNEDVDQRMIKTLADLNTELGLEAIEKFASSNLETVRSKTGFMMGIIRRVGEAIIPPRMWLLAVRVFSRHRSRPAHPCIVQYT